MIKTLYKYTLIAIFLFACKNEKVVKEYYSNGNLKFTVQVDEKGVQNGLYEQYYDSGELLKKLTYKEGKIVDTVLIYYKNGKVKEKGKLYNDSLKIGWWNYYSSNGNLINKNEYLILGDSIYKNQTIKFQPDGNVGKLYYSSNFINASDKILDVIIENEYLNSEIKLDTFGERPNETRFGVFANKIGYKTIKGSTLETLFYKNRITVDSFNLTIKTHKKYFEKKLYVKDTID